MQQQSQAAPQPPSLRDAGDADSALKSLVGRDVSVLTTFSEGSPGSPSVYVGSLLAVFPDAIVLLAELFPARGEVLVY
ncbi:MAG: hypothetical protein ACXWQR_06985, partial [Ktedonobacterales bacterium]